MWEAGKVLECKASPSSSTVLMVASESWGEGSLFGAGISVNNSHENHVITVQIQLCHTIVKKLNNGFVA